MKKYGFYCRMYGKDCFMETEQKNRTERLALDFINKVQNKLNSFSNVDENAIKFVKANMRMAWMEVKTLNNGLSYIDISGENFGGYGCDPCENPFEVCVIV
jgi:hypothetical protein